MEITVEMVLLSQDCLYYLCYDVTVFIDQSKQVFSNDATENFNRLKEISGVLIKDFF